MTPSQRSTPGPWEVGSRHGATTHVTGPRCGPDGSRYRTIPGIVIAFVQDPADARLIAAAPTMLAALKDLIAEIEAKNCQGAFGSDYDRSRAAIARAEGKS